MSTPAESPVVEGSAPEESTPQEATQQSIPDVAAGDQALAPPAVEPRAARFARQAHRARLYASAGIVVGLVALLIVLASANTRVAKLDWVFGSTHASVAWIVVAAAVFGWLLGIATSLAVQHRTRRPR